MTRSSLLALSSLFLCAQLLASKPPAYETEVWPQTRTLTWANPGQGGKLADASSWLENDKPAAAAPDRDTDIVLPASDSTYRVNSGGGAVRHVTVERGAMFLGAHRNEVEIWGNCDVKEGGRVYYISLRGPRHSYLRIDGGEFPNQQNGLSYGHTGEGGRDMKNSTQISHKLQVCKFGDASVEFIGKFGVSDEIMVQHGKLIIGPKSELRWSGVTNKGALEVYDGGILELESGARVGPFQSVNRKKVYNVDVYRNGRIQAGSPERPLTEDAFLLLGFAENNSPGVSGLYAAAGSQIRVHSANPAKARLVVNSLTSDPEWRNGSGRREAKSEGRASGSTGVMLQLAGDVQLDGVHFDYICEGGLALADASMKDRWKNVTHGPNCAGPESKLAGPLTEDANIYYHTRGDGESEFALTTRAVKSMEKYLEQNDPYKLEMEPAAVELKNEGKIKNKPVSIVFRQTGGGDHRLFR